MLGREDIIFVLPRAWGLVVDVRLMFGNSVSNIVGKEKLPGVGSMAASVLGATNAAAKMYSQMDVNIATHTNPDR